MTSSSLIDRAEGALLGLACGDALGAPLVGMGRDQARIKHGVVTHFIGGGMYLLAPGEVTGRVRLALGLAHALGASKRRDDLPALALAAYLEGLAMEPPGLGEVTRAALSRIEEGMAPPEAAAAARDAVESRTGGIGPALRCVPYALLFHDDPVRLATVVLEDAGLTHLDRRAQAGAALLALWVREHLLGEDDPLVAAQAARDVLRSVKAFPEVLPPVAALTSLPVRPTAYPPDVFHVVLKHVLEEHTVGRQIAGAANEGGEAAALGAATGAVAGARFGASALPDSWTSVLPGATAWRHFAAALVGGAPLDPAAPR